MICCCWCYVVLLLVAWCVCSVLSSLLDWLAKQTKLLSANMEHNKEYTFGWKMCEMSILSANGLISKYQTWDGKIYSICFRLLLLLLQRKWQEIRTPSIVRSTDEAKKTQNAIKYNHKSILESIYYKYDVFVVGWMVSLVPLYMWLWVFFLKSVQIKCVHLPHFSNIQMSTNTQTSIQCEFG